MAPSKVELHILCSHCTVCLKPASRIHRLSASVQHEPSFRRTFSHYPAGYITGTTEAQQVGFQCLTLNHYPNPTAAVLSGEPVSHSMTRQAKRVSRRGHNSFTDPVITCRLGMHCLLSAAILRKSATIDRIGKEPDAVNGPIKTPGHRQWHSC